MSWEFPKIHAELWHLYKYAIEKSETADMATCFALLREKVLAQKCAASLEVYERYLRLVSLHLDSEFQLEELSLLNRSTFDAEMKRQPGAAFSQFGMALTELKQGNLKRGRHLLRRIAASRYPERFRARALLIRLVVEEARA
jgi:hypothetical protein